MWSGISIICEPKRVSKTIFEIKATKYSNNISTPMLSGSGKKIVSLSSMVASAPPKISGGGFGE